MTTTLSTSTPTLPPADLAAALSLRDLTDPAQGVHAVNLLLDEVVEALSRSWSRSWSRAGSGGAPGRTDVRRRSPLVAVEDNYDRLGYAPSDVTRDARYSRYAGETVMLRSHTSAGVPPALRELSRRWAVQRRDDVLLVLPGICHRRDSIDRLHVGTPHQVDLWRLTDARLTGDDLLAMAGVVVQAVLPGARWRAVPAVHPYTTGGLQLDVETPQGWVELAECGLAAPAVLAANGVDPTRWNGLALGMGLDRAVMLRKGIPDVRVLRSTEPRTAAQLLDLTPWRPVSHQPAVRRDLSVALDGEPDVELLGELVRSALGDRADDVESLEVLGATSWGELPEPARERLGMNSRQTNVLLRLVLRPLDHTLTDHEANLLRDEVYAAVHRGSEHEWTAR